MGLTRQPSCCLWVEIYDQHSDELIRWFGQDRPTRTWASSMHQAYQRGTTVGEVRPQDPPPNLEVAQIRICAPCDLSIKSFADWRKNDRLPLRRDLRQRV